MVRRSVWITLVASVLGVIGGTLAATPWRDNGASCCPAGSSEATPFDWSLALPVGLGVAGLVLVVGLSLAWHFRVH